MSTGATPAHVKSWTTDDDEANRLCEASTRRLITRLREMTAAQGDPTSYGEAWERVIEAMIDERDARDARGLVDGGRRVAPNSASLRPS